ncbi:hypothetical protein ABZV58_29325 [Nocardia sp. NPDC004654]|uniref:hypothetical protein n=1 Tax=Nocardia sp. NPDC004654 TaxID=3154776 RepID=UPI0033BF8C5D
MLLGQLGDGLARFVAIQGGKMMRHNVLAFCLVAGSVLLASCSSEPETFTMSGTVEDRTVDVRNEISPGEAKRDRLSCRGTNSSPIYDGGPIEVIDGAGVTVAAGKIVGGNWAPDRQGCLFTWEVRRVPAGLKIYKVVLPQKSPTRAYTEEEASKPIDFQWG